MFPDGISHEYSITAMFRLRKTTKKDRWFVLQIFDKGGDTQVCAKSEILFRSVKKTLINLSMFKTNNSCKTGKMIVMSFARCDRFRLQSAYLINCLNEPLMFISSSLFHLGVINSGWS